MRGFGLCRGGGEGKHISLAAIFEGKHISLVICVRGHTYHGETHITVTAPVEKFHCFESEGGLADFILLLFTMSAIVNCNGDWKRTRWRARTSSKASCALNSFLKTALYTVGTDYFCTVFRPDLAERCHL